MAPSTQRFDTERIRRFRAGDLEPQDERTIANIEKFGCGPVCCPWCISG